VTTTLAVRKRAPRRSAARRHARRGHLVLQLAQLAHASEEVGRKRLVRPLDREAEPEAEVALERPQHVRRWAAGALALAVQAVGVRAR